MGQPEWKLVDSTDCRRVLVDVTGQYAPEAEYADEIEAEDFRDDKPARFYVYRYSLDSYMLTPDGHLTGPGGHVPWFEDDQHKSIPGEHTAHGYCVLCGGHVSKNLSSAADSHSMEPAELRRLFCSDKPTDLALAWETIGGHHGYDNLDGYPVEVTEPELDERWSNAAKHRTAGVSS